jgi:hypothetical protein
VKSVFAGGSRNIKRLNDLVRGRLDSIIEKNLMVFVGDAAGADKAIQKHLADQKYRNVIVYCMDGGPRNNVGNWEVRLIRGIGASRGWQYFAQKDSAMAKDASCGFMLWDGRSKGTVNNLLNLLQFGKVSVLYTSGDDEFATIRAPNDLRAILAHCPGEHLVELESKLDLDARLASREETLPLR